MHKLRQIFAALTVSLGTFGYGNTIAWTAAAIPQLKTPRGGLWITEDEASWIASSMAIGGAIGGIIITILTKYLGRKWCMSIFSILFIIGWVMIGLAFDVYMIIGGRIITGAMSCAYTIVASIYVAEISHHKRRGRLGSIINVMVAFGIIFVLIIGTYIRWNISAYLCALPHVIGLISILFILPESPHYLLSNGNVEGARNTIKWFQIPTDVEDIYDDIRSHIHEEKQSFKSWDRFSVKMVAVLSMIMIFGRLSGISVMSYYTVEIMSQATSMTIESSEIINSNTAAILGASMELVGCFIGTFLIDKIGRKILLITSSIGLAITMFGLGYIYHFINGGDDLLIPLICVGSFYICFAFGHALVPTILMGELFKPNLKSIGSTISMTFCWLFNFLTGKFFYVLKDYLGGLSGVFWMFSIFSFIGAIFIGIFLPETKNKTLHQIQSQVNSSKNSSSNYAINNDHHQNI